MPYIRSMRYISTRGAGERLPFLEAVMTGLARDGGLIVPECIPDVRDRLAEWSRLSYPQLACEIMRLYADDLSPEDLARMVREAYATFSHPQVTPLSKVGDVYVLELFHGPTLAFKDVALQFLGRLFEYALVRRGARLNVLTATSGDTGSAAIHGLRGRRGLRVFVMHPRGRISPVQERQMTTVLDDNVFNLAVEGTFDDCQRIMKALLSDLDFRDRYALGTVNSINWARLLAQIVYYFHAGLNVLRSTGAARVRFAVPTGNFGDIFSGYLAARMGLPVSRLILATNENDILSRFFRTGEYRRSEVKPTISPSMDIQVASNFERYLYERTGRDARTLRRHMEEFERRGALRIEAGSDGRADSLIEAGSADTAATLRTIRETYERHGYVLDPHSAVGAHVAQHFLEPTEPMICLATAHPAKFPEAIREATGRDDLARHPTLEALMNQPTRCDVMPAAEAAVKDYIQRHVPQD